MAVVDFHRMNNKSKENIKEPSRSSISNTLNLIGDKWSLLIIRDMMYEKKCTYNEFLNSQEGISTNILSQRLFRLVEIGLITYTPMKRKKYRLTDKGRFNLFYI